MPIEAAILPCPFCSQPAVLTNVRESNHTFIVGCYNESCVRPRTDGYGSKEDVVRLWNQRPDDLPTEDEVIKEFQRLSQSATNREYAELLSHSVEQEERAEQAERVNEAERAVREDLGRRLVQAERDVAILKLALAEEHGYTRKAERKRDALAAELQRLNG